MFRKHVNNGTSLKAYKGSLMTLLAMDLDERPADGSFAGFTLHYTRRGGRKTAIRNMLNFAGRDEITGSDVSPIQLFKWVHFPGSYSQTGMLSGEYTYSATPRFFDNDRRLLPLDSSKTATVTIDVSDFSDGKCQVGFTRAFVKSQAFTNRYGQGQKLRPPGDWLFDTSQKAGNHSRYGDFTYEDMYAWLGFNARTLVYEVLQEALQTPGVTADMFAYDFNDPVIAHMCLELAAKGKLRMIMDDASLHHGKRKNGKLTEEDDFETRFRKVATGSSAIYRCHFARFAHCKEIILRRKGNPYKALSGSTNFSYTGLYINANHVLVFENHSVAQYFGDVFDACWQQGSAPAFRQTTFARIAKKFYHNNIPAMDVNASPHDKVFAGALIDAVTDRVLAARTDSVLFSVMQMGANTTGSLIPALRSLHKNEQTFTYGITDKSDGEVSLYKPGRKSGLLIDAKKANRELPPPFKKEFNLGLAHAIHHKFVVVDFNKRDAAVYCGSSNLALGGEQDNGDKLLCIKDTDVATVFAIEALRLTDHYNFRSVQQKADKATEKAGEKKPAKLDVSGKWADKFFDKNDIRYMERRVFR